jgi:hypothetical protein
MTNDFRPLQILETLNRNGVQYVVIGGIAATLHGSSMMTNDLDICYRRDRENLVRLAAALKELQARPRHLPADVHIVLDDHTLRNGDLFTLETVAGDFDCLGTPQGTTGFGELHAAAADAEIAPNLIVRLCSLDHLIRMKRAAGRPKDLLALEFLEELQRLAAQP